MKLDLQATPEEVMRAVEAVQDFGRACGFGEKDLFSIALALEECGSNIVNYALRGDPQKKFQVALECTPDFLVMELRDPGPEFDPTKAAERPAQAHDDDLPGGWGLQLIRRHMDDIRYERAGGENILRLRKRLRSAAPKK